MRKKSKQARKDAESKAILTLDDLPASTAYAERTFIRLGSKWIDDQLLRGGIPEGQIIEIQGEEGCGKTLLAIRIAAQAQRKHPDKLVIWIDSENRYDADWWERHGVDTDPDRWRVYNTNKLERTSELIIQAIQTGAVSVVVVDSLANNEEQDMMSYESFRDDKIGVGGKARKIGRLVRAVGGIQFEYRTTFVVINQMREKIGVLFGSNETTPGGKALKHDTSVRIKVLYPGDDILDGDEIAAHRVNMLVKKNSIMGIPKVDRTDEKTALVCYLDDGIERSQVIELVDEAIELGIIDVSGSWHQWDDMKVQGRNKFLQEFLDDDDLVDTLREQIENSEDESSRVTVNAKPPQRKNFFDE